MGVAEPDVGGVVAPLDELHPAAKLRHKIDAARRYASRANERKYLPSG
jgi:hypothetical protein